MTWRVARRSWRLLEESGGEWKKVLKSSATDSTRKDIGGKEQGAEVEGENKGEKMKQRFLLSPKTLLKETKEKKEIFWQNLVKIAFQGILGLGGMGAGGKKPGCLFNIDNIFYRHIWSSLVVTIVTFEAIWL